MKKYIVMISADGTRVRRQETKFDRQPGDKMFFDGAQWTVITSPVDLDSAIEIFNFTSKKLKAA